MSDRITRENLAAAYHLVAHYGYDDLTFAHLSARTLAGDAFFINPFGLLFEEVTASRLLTVNFAGEVLQGEEYQYNRTGYVIHGSIYKHRPELNCVFHLHTEASIAVSAMPEGLLPLSQWALHFYNRVAYHDYNSLALTPEEHENALVNDLAQHKILFLRNHGILIAGETIHEAFIYLHHLERACRTQIKILSMTEKPITPSATICEQSVKDLLGFEKDIGKRDWLALLRLLELKKSNYKD